jgi:hypothetical protein
MVEKIKLRLEQITLDPQAQPRDHLSMDVVAEYAEAMTLGATFPPLVVFHDGDRYWLADGFHRHYAAKAAELVEFDCDVSEGGLRDAILYSVGANAAHGYRRTNADKRRAVMTMLTNDLVRLDANGNPWSDRHIARMCAVSAPMVSGLRPEPIHPSDTVKDLQYEPRTFIHPKTGQPTVMNTARIGSSRSPERLVERERETPPAWSTANISPEVKADIDQDNANAFIANRLWDVEAAVKSLPEPKDAARRFPSSLLHTFSAEQARTLRDWFDAFATEWDLTKGTTNVAAE